MIALLLRNAPLRQLALGSAASQLGMQIGWIALVWWVLNEARSPQLLGALFVAFQLPMLASAPFIGALLDRHDAKRVALCAVCVSIAARTALAVMASLHDLTLPVLFTLVTIVSLTLPATLTYRRIAVGQIAGREDLPAAYGLFSLGSEVAILVGPAAGGFIVGQWATGAALWAFAIGPACYALAIAASTYTRDERRHERTIDVLQGVREIASRPIVLGVTLITFFFFLAYGPLEVALPMAARTVFHTNAAGYGTMWSAYAVGSVTGLLLLRSRYQRFPTTLVLSGIAIVWGVLACALAFTTALPAAMAVLLVAGFFWSPYNALESAFMQRQVPARVQGAVFSMQSSFLYVLAVPLGAMAGGWALARTSPGSVMFASGAACVLAGIIGCIALRPTRATAELTSAS